MEFNDISSEQYREYRWPDGTTVRLDAPVSLNVSASGGHRVLTADGVSNYVPTGWVHLRWLVKDGKPAFVI